MKLRRVFCFALFAYIVSDGSGLCIRPIPFTSRFPPSSFSLNPNRRKSVSPSFAKGFGSGFAKASKDGKGNSKSKKSKQSGAYEKRAQAERDRLLEQYGGDIARGTSERITRALAALPPHVRMAADLYKQVQQWESRVRGLTVLDQTSIHPQDFEIANKAQERLHKLYEDHGITEQDMHNLFQQVTWDAAADAKASRASQGTMSAHFEHRVKKACSIVASALKVEGASRGRCLDVGCGPGMLVPYLTGAGILPKQITGVDLSPEMIKNARRKYRGVNFFEADFLNFVEKDGFSAIMFCSSLHDLPDPVPALRKAVSLLREGGKLVIIHPQGASHVVGQMKSNPVMVKQPLPTGEELRKLELGLELEHSPADVGSNQEAEEGYLAVLRK